MAQRLEVSIPRVRATVGRAGVLRTKFDPSTIDREASLVATPPGINALFVRRGPVRGDAAHQRAFPLQGCLRLAVDVP